MGARGLAHECRVEATALRAGNAADPAAIAGMLEQCATTLEEMDAADRVAESSLDDIEAQALAVYQRANSDDVNPQSLAWNLAECIVSLCAYLKKEKAIA